MGCRAEACWSEGQLAEQLFVYFRVSLALPIWARGKYFAGCSKSSSRKTGGESKPEAYPRGYVEDFDEPRTKRADFFSILLVLGFAGVQIPVLPVEPGMA